MIESFCDRWTAAVFGGRMPKGFQSDVANVARRKLRMLQLATVDRAEAHQPQIKRMEAWLHQLETQI